MFGKNIKNYAYTWLSAKGYKPVDRLRDAHSSIVFTPREKERTVYVPGQTYSVPVYGNAFGGGQKTSSTVKDQFGQTVGTIETKEQVDPLQPTGYQTHYREGYNTNVKDRALSIAVWRAERGKMPELSTLGYTYPSEYSMSFFEDENTMKNAVSKLLNQSVLGKVVSAPISNSHEAPGCWPLLGITWDQDSVKESKFIIQAFMQESKAAEYGLKVGDQVTMIGNSLISADKPPRYDEGDVVRVIALRGKKMIEAKVPTVMTCAD